MAGISRLRNAGSGFPQKHQTKDGLNPAEGGGQWSNFASILQVA
jgi:hypothetical protein